MAVAFFTHVHTSGSQVSPALSESCYSSIHVFSIREGEWRNTERCRGRVKENSKRNPRIKVNQIAVWVGMSKVPVWNKPSCKVNVDLMASQLFLCLWPVGPESLSRLQLLVPPEHISSLPASPSISNSLLLISPEPKQQMLKCRRSLPPLVNSQKSKKPFGKNIERISPVMPCSLCKKPNHTKLLVVLPTPSHCHKECNEVSVSFLTGCHSK